jgi:hypothetical protein
MMMEAIRGTFRWTCGAEECHLLSAVNKIRVINHIVRFVFLAGEAPVMRDSEPGMYFVTIEHYQKSDRPPLANFAGNLKDDCMQGV